jgi:tetrapyrrole methylase family protein/MazG family protein
VVGGERAATSGEVLRNWEALKLAERQQSGKAAPAESMLDSVPRSLPAVMEAFQASTKVARVGFEWPDAAGVLAKLDEEVRELRDEAERTEVDPRRVADEVGDLLFTAVNVARVLGVDPESALKAANRKFRRRFGHVEARLREGGRGPAGATLAEMEALWQEAKSAERPAGPR